MKNVLVLFFNTILNIGSKFLLELLSKSNSDKEQFLKKVLKLALFIFINNVFILIPLVFLNYPLFVFKTFLFFTVGIFIILSMIIFIQTRNQEKIDKTFVETSIYKKDFFIYLKNDIFFNLKFSLILTIIFSIYNLIVYLTILMMKKVNIIQFLIIFTSFVFLFYILFNTINLIYYFKKRDVKNIFFQISNYKDIKFHRLLYFFIFSLLNFIFLFFLFKIFIQSILLLLLICFILSIFSTIILITFLSKKGFFNKTKWIIFIKDSKDFLFSLKSKIKTEGFFALFAHIKFLYPLLIFVIGLIILLFLNNFFKLSFNIIFFQAILLPMFFIYPLTKNKLSVIEKRHRPFIFTSFIFSIIFITNFFQPTDLEIFFEKNPLLNIFKDFVLPIFTTYNNFCISKNTFFNKIHFLFYLFLPLLFFIIYYISNQIYSFKRYVEKLIDSRLKNKLFRTNSALIFGDSISQYNFFFSLIINIIVISILMLEKTPISNLFFTLTDTLQIATVFKFAFLTKENIFLFFNNIINLITIVIVIKLIFEFLSSVFSHFMLFSDEIVYIENKILTKTTLRIPISKINYIIIKQNFIEKLLDIGSIFIETIDKNGLICIKSISSLKDKNVKIMERIKVDIQKTK